MSFGIRSASTLMSRGPPLACAGTWRVVQPDTPQLTNSRLEKLIHRMSNLPKYYFQDIPAEVMEEIVRGMQQALPEPNLEEIDYWLNCHNHAATIPDWYERADEFISDQRLVLA